MDALLEEADQLAEAGDVLGGPAGVEGAQIAEADEQMVATGVNNSGTCVWGGCGCGCGV
jgi:hypothetical protein